MARRKRAPQPSKKSPLRWWLAGLAALLVTAFMLLRSPAQVSAPVIPTATPTTARATATTTTAPPTEAAAATASPAIVTPAPPASPTPAPTGAVPPGDVPTYGYTIINTYPHDPDAFTQGLIYLDDIFYEGTGLNGRSSLRKVAVETGEVLQLRQMPPEYFGEGITIFGDRLIQLTWKTQRGFEYNKDTFEPIRDFTYPTEGWGITHDGAKLIMSDGSDTLFFWDPDTFEEIGRVQVFDAAGPVVRLNELEYVDGEVFANIWQTNRIARINPDTGQVVGWIDLTGLLTAADHTEPVDVLNGIAYDDATDRLFVTGKLWPKLFEIELVPQGGNGE